MENPIPDIRREQHSNCLIRVTSEVVFLGIAEEEESEEVGC